MDSLTDNNPLSRVVQVAGWLSAAPETTPRGSPVHLASPESGSAGLGSVPSDGSPRGGDCCLRCRPCLPADTSTRCCCPSASWATMADNADRWTQTQMIRRSQPSSGGRWADDYCLGVFFSLPNADDYGPDSVLPEATTRPFAQIIVREGPVCPNHRAHRRSRFVASVPLAQARVAAGGSDARTSATTRSPAASVADSFTCAGVRAALAVGDARHSPTIRVIETTTRCTWAF